MSEEQIVEQEEMTEEVHVEEEVTTLKNALAQETDRVLRIAAEYENYRKRSQKEREALYVDVKSDVVLALLPVYDNLERALQQECKDQAFYTGIEMIMTQLNEIFGKLGLSPIGAVGEQFDPEYHNAVSHVEDEKAGENEIVEQFMQGFLLGDKVIRHSMVKVEN